MNPPTLLQFATSEVLARNVAELWLGEMERAWPNKPWCVALSGGRIAGRLFVEMVKQVRKRGVALSGMDFFWGDERCVPPNDPESNFGVAYQTLLAPLAIDPARIHRVRGEVSSEIAAVEAEAELRRVAPDNQKGQPVLDLVFLGMGEDGHIASLFPNEPEEVGNTPAVYRAVIGPKPPPARVTLNYPALAAARQVWVLASGPGKEEALRRSLAQPPSTPLGRLLSMRQSTRIFTDIRLEAG